MTLVLIIGMVLVAIAWHELGHYAVARLFGINVQEYSVGIGPLAFARRIGRTRFSFRWLPLGGFVDPADWSDLEDPGEVAKLEPQERQMLHKPEGWFSNQPLHERLLMLAAGPLMNIGLAFALFYMVKSAPGFNPSGWDLVRAAWDLKARAAVAGVPIPETTKLVDHFAGLQQALALGDGRIIRVFATVNMGLAVLNLLPILPLDGGQIVWNCVIEWFDRGLVGKKRLANRRVWMRRFQTLALIGLAVIIIGQFIF